MADNIFVFISYYIFAYFNRNFLFFGCKITLNREKMFPINMSLCIKSRFLVCKIMIFYSILAIFT